LPEDKDRMIQVLTGALAREERTFRPFFIGHE
jgi:hypothetical protein